jgi:type II secretory pathway component PulF
MLHCFISPDKQYTKLKVLSRALSKAFASQQHLSQALDTLSHQQSLKKLGSFLRPIAFELKGTRSATQAFFKHKNKIGTFFCEALRQGELSADPEGFFSRLADYYEENDRFRKEIFRSLKYPAIIAAGATGAIVTLLAVSIPAAVRTIPAYSENIPLITRIVVHALTVRPQALLALLIIALFLLTCAWCSNAKFHLLDKLAPDGAPDVRFFGSFSRKLSLRRIALNLSFLLSNGVGISDALRISAETLRHTPYRDKLIGIARKIHENGASLPAAMKDAGNIFPPLVFDVPPDSKPPYSEAGRFRKIAEFYEEEIRTAVTVTAIVLEPLIVAIAGLLGGGILAALYLPLLRTL